MPTALETLPVARTTPPPLHDSSRFVKLERVPILDEHVRTRRTDDGQVIEEYVSPEQLAVICRNSEQRAKGGNYGLVLIGHTDPDLPETEQPPVVGFMENYRMGRLPDGKPTILADVYIEREHETDIKRFPRRSVEIFRKMTPQGYIDALSLLVRAPERDLGLVLYAKSAGVERYQCRCHDPSTYDKEPYHMADDEKPDSGSETKAEPGTEISDELVNRLADRIAERMCESDKFTDKIIGRMGQLFEEKAEEETPEGGEKEPENYEGAAGSPSGTNTEVPGTEGGETREKQTDETMAETMSKNLAVEFASLKQLREQDRKTIKALSDRVEKAEQYAKDQQTAATRADRLRQLEKLAADGYEIDPAARIEKYAKYTDEQFTDAVQDIRDHYRRSPADGREIRTASFTSGPNPAPGTAEEGDGLTDEEVESGAVARYARENKIDILTPTDGSKVVERYLKSDEHKAHVKARREKAGRRG